MDRESRQIVLVADDDADVRDLVAFRLDRAGYEVMAAADGQDALELARSRSPDIAVLDVMMPRLDGLQVTRQMRAIDELARVPVLLLTASVHEAAVTQGFEAGADDYMKKPFSPAELVARVRALLGRT
jgi:DNA-binding response OmpR family regulator